MKNVHSLIKIIPNEKDIQNLKKLISKKRKSLKLLDSRYMKLQHELNLIEKEYEVRIGTLFRRDIICDKELDILRRIKRLMRQGLRYHEAKRAVEDENKREYIKNHKKQWEYYFEPQDTFFLKSSPTLKNLHTIWKKLIKKFHPDLSTSDEDKKEREKITKIINNAYNASDEETLKTLEEKQKIEYEIKDNTESVKDLEHIIEELEHMYERVHAKYESLKKSEWYRYRKKTALEREMLFKNFEKELLRSIMQKEMMLSELHRNLG